MDFKIEGKLLQYLQGKISFNEWLDGAATVDNSGDKNLDNATAKQTIGRRFPSSTAQMPPSTSTSTLHGISSEIHTNSEVSRTLTANSLKEFMVNEDKNTQGPSENVDDDSDDDDFDEEFEEERVEEDEFEIDESSQSNDFETESYGEKGLHGPQFSLPDRGLVPATSNLEMLEKLYEVVKKMSELLSDVAKSVNLGTEDPTIKKVFAEFITPKQRRLRKSGPSSHKLREDLRQQMGMANLYLAKGQIDEATEVCMEIIRQAPHNPHAFKTLSVIYDEKGDTEKSLQFALISAFLGCQDPHEWRDLAIRCLHAGNRKQALVCYNHGCKASKGNIVLRWERASLVFEDGDHKRALELYNTILKLNPSKDGDKMIELGKQMAQLHHSADNLDKAIDILETLTEKFPDHLDLEGVHMLAELHILSKNFGRALEVICKHSGVKIPEKAVSSVEKHEAFAPGNSEERHGLKMPEEMVHCINQIAESTETVSAAPNLEFTAKFAKSLIQEKPSKKDSSKQTDLTTVPSSWTDFLLSPTKDSHFKDGAWSEKEASFKEDLNTSQKDFVDLDQSTADVRKGKDAANDADENKWFVPDDLPIDIRVKTALCLIELKIVCNVRHILGPLFSEDIDNVGDLYLDVAEAYIDVGRSEEALTYLEALIRSEKYSKAAVWLKIAECRQNVGMLSEAVDAYYKVLDLAPDQLGVTLELANLCRRLGRTEEAVKILSEPSNSDMVDERSSQGIIEISNADDFKLWYQKCTLLQGQGHSSGLADNGYIFFINYFKSAAISREEGLSKALVWELLVKVLQALVSTGQHSKAKEVIERTSSFRSFSDNRRYRCELEFISATTYLLTGDYLRAFDAFRWALIRAEKKGLNSPAMWNFFNRIVNNMPDRKYHKYILRMLFKQPAVLPLIIANGHNAFLCGSYKYAIGEYIRAFRMKPQDPMLSMCIGITYLHISCQRFTKHRHTSVLQGIAFMLQYYHMRGKTQEACYNLGRAFHQVGLVHFAYIFYNKALSFPTKNEKYSQFDDLHREAAYNLALIYKNSGNIDLARRTLYKYIWI